MGSDPVNWLTILKLVVQVATPLTLGIIVGSLPYYYAAYYGEEYLLKRYGKYVGLRYGDVQKVLQRFKQGTKDEWIFFIARIIPIIPSVAVNVFGGVIKMPIRTYVWISFVALFVRSVIVGFVGWQAARGIVSLRERVDTVDNIGLWVLVVILVFVAGWMVYRISTRSRR